MKFLASLILSAALAVPALAADLSKDLKPDSRYYGVGWQSDGNHWSVELLITENGGQVAYPSANCSGNWTLTKATKDQTKYIERITEGVDDCIVLGTVILEPLSDGRLLYTFREHAAVIDARAVLLPATGARLDYMDALILTLNTIEFDYLLQEYFE